jgi:hypothetical protein
MTQFMFNSTLATLLSERTWMSPTAIEFAMANYARERVPFTIKTTRPGNDHYKVWPVEGGWNVRPWKMFDRNDTMSLK